MERTRTFQDIEAEMARLMAIDENGLGQEERDARELYVAAISVQEAGKVDAFARFMRMQAAKAKHLREESARLAARARSMEANISWLKGVYLQVMRRHGKDRVEGQAYAIRRQRSKYVLVTDEAALDPDFIRTETRKIPDKALIRDAIENGVEVEGAILGESETVVIR